ncbi:MAG: putative manganese-dependent inorganic diphosphatase [Clostridiales bacterium]|nr:putative manganese-dependent inorganic diphosphatase [Clostridiales bacterium]
MAEEKTKKILILGHKNPDTDSICSAIAYANLKNKIKASDDVEYIPMRAGQLNNETQFVLKYFKAAIPNYISDAHMQLRDVRVKKIAGIPEDYSLKRAWAQMKEINEATLPITDGKKLKGVISIRDIVASDLDTYDSRVLSKANTQFKNIVEALDGEMILGDENEYFSQGKVMIAAGNPDMMEEYIEKGDVVILSNRYDSQLCAIEMNARCIIVSTGAKVANTIIKLAKEHNCMIISSPHDTFTIARMINHSMPVGYFMSYEKLVTFEPDTLVDVVREEMAKVRFRDFPIVDKHGNYLGMTSRRVLLNVERKKLILVDHNEKSQAVDGLEQAEILEIIDHHRVGSIETNDPIFVRNQPLGCTATIITLMYRENGVEIQPEIAGLLCSAIISDTLMFRSPTCTAVDKQIAEDLAKIAGIQIEKYAEEMFAAASDLKSKTAEEVFFQDFKKFVAKGINFGVGQISSMSADELKDIKKRLMPIIEKNLKEQNLQFLLFMLTNILTEDSEVIYCGENAAEILKNAFQVEPSADGDTTVILKKVVSRKKQLIPPLMAALQ